MATSIDVANMALSHIGEDRIVTLGDESENARLCTLWFEQSRKDALRSANWTCALKRRLIPADAAAPEYGFTNRYAKPADFIRLTRVRNAREGVDYSVEGDYILTNMSSPLGLLYVHDLQDVSKFDSDLVVVFSYWLAHHIAGRLAPSKTAELLQVAMLKASEAKNVDALSVGPQPLEPTSWVTARLGGRNPGKWWG